MKINCDFDLFLSLCLKSVIAELCFLAPNLPERSPGVFLLLRLLLLEGLLNTRKEPTPFGEELKMKNTIRH